jgi:SAM-dependent methyltransferase
MPTTPPAYSFARYLAAKRSVDDRALHRGVADALRAGLAARAAAGRDPLRVAEVGAGIGTMVERALDWGLFPPGACVEYVALDAEAQNVDAARARLAALPAWLDLCLETADLHAWAAAPANARRYDLLIANAVLDLLDLDAALPALAGVLRPGGLAWFTLNFDGATLFEPPLDPDFDAAVEAAYHRTMDERDMGGGPCAGSRTGRRLFSALRAAGFDVAAAGASDWIVYGGPSGYPADEAYFLHHILHFVEGALAGDPALDPARLRDWLDARHAQVERGELAYVAHQLDFLARVA